MTDIILLFHLIQYFVLKGSFERMASAHGDENHKVHEIFSSSSFNVAQTHVNAVV